jgi:hypothetical protein
MTNLCHWLVARNSFYVTIRECVWVLHPVIYFIGMATFYINDKICPLFYLKSLRAVFHGPLFSTNFHRCATFVLPKSKSKRTTDSQSASLSWCQASLRAYDQFLFLLEIFLRQLQVCYFMASSLTRGRVCNLLLLLGLANTVPLGSESLGTQDHISLSQFLRLPKPGGPSPQTYIPAEEGGPVILRALGSLYAASYDSQGYGGGIPTRLHTGNCQRCFLSWSYSESDSKYSVVVYILSNSIAPSILTRLRAGRPGNRDSIPSRSNRLSLFPSIHTNPGLLSISYIVCTWGYFY